MGQIKALLYDLDGVLVDACEWHYVAFNRALDELCGFTVPRDAHETHLNALPTYKKLEVLESQGKVKREQFDKIWRLKQEYTILTIEENAALDEGKIELHTETGRLGYRIACVTNCAPASAELMLSNTGQWHFMEFMIANTDVELPKPHPEGYLTAFARMGLKPDEVLIIEDSAKGIQAATAAGGHILRVKDATEVTLERVLERINEL